jgi:hypothetical protein
MESAQFVNGVISLHTIAQALVRIPQWRIVEHISISYRKSAGEQLWGFARVLLDDGRLEPKPIPRPDAICLEQSVCLKIRRLGIGVLVRAGAAAKNEQIDAKSPAEVSLVEKEGTETKPI